MSTLGGGGFGGGEDVTGGFGGGEDVTGGFGGGEDVTGGGGDGGADEEDLVAVSGSGGGGDDTVLESSGGSEEKTREGLVAVKRLKRKKRESERSANAVILTKVGVLTTSLKVVAVTAFMMVFFWTAVCFSGKLCEKVKSKPEVNARDGVGTCSETN